ncbi:MAG: hypothetical protein ACRD4Q_06060 [Candidatus Acidiferrales bacterium]
MKYLLLLTTASLAAGLTLAAAAHSSASCRKWQNLCIPKKYQPVFSRDFSSGHPAPNGLARFVQQFPGMDVSTVPSAIFDFSEKEMAAAIPGYIEHRGYLYFTKTVTIKPAALAREERVNRWDRVLYNLRDNDSFGPDFTHAVVEKLPDLPYYKVNPMFSGTHDTETVWYMVKVDLRDKLKRPPIKPPTWYIGSCTGNSDPKLGSDFSCIRMLADPKFPYYIQYNIEQPNAHLIPEIDAFIESKIRSWEIEPTVSKSSQ